ncbi:MAG: M15 family metallopeptidase [Desulfovibrio sp.]|nr:M15 family metallopeptidase [Desulfovibrio sp.]
MTNSALPSPEQSFDHMLPDTLDEEDRLNLSCLLSVYPSIAAVEKEKSAIWLRMRSGERVLYGSDHALPFANTLEADIRTSMRDLYALEPKRPETPLGYAPGRKRPYALFYTLYGANEREVKRHTRSVHALHQYWRFVPEAAEAFLNAAKELDTLLRHDPSLRPWLTNAGTFSWRFIAGETVLSAHSFGIAFDIGVKKGATYWRWCPLRPHPLQKTFSPLIVAAFEKQGFIWGGKWHEYDLMHFEYRPELICKARMVQKKDLGKREEKKGNATSLQYSLIPTGKPVGLSDNPE